MVEKRRLLRLSARATYNASHKGLPWLTPQSLPVRLCYFFVFPQTAVANKFHRHTRPGGWIEFQEMHHLPHCDDNTMPSDFPLLNFFKVVTEGLRNIGVS